MNYQIWIPYFIFTPQLVKKSLYKAGFAAFPSCYYDSGFGESFWYVSYPFAEMFKLIFYIPAYMQSLYIKYIIYYIYDFAKKTIS